MLRKVLYILTATSIVASASSLSARPLQSERSEPAAPLQKEIIAYNSSEESNNGRESNAVEERSKSSKVTNEDSSSNFQAFTGKIIGNNVRMRSQSNLDSQIIREVSKDELFLITGEENGFYFVKPPTDIKAYIFRTYVLDKVVEGNNVNVRLGPNREAAVIAQLNTGDKIDGTISPLNNKWVEITPPESTRFFVAKEYFENAGSPDLLTQMESRRSEAHHLLNSSYLIAQAEMRKSFEEIDIDRISSSFEKIIKDYSDFAGYSTKAKEVLDLVQETYLQKKIAFLEAKTQQSTRSWATINNKLSDQISSYEKRLSKFEEELSFETPTKSLQSNLKVESSIQKANPQVVEAIVESVENGNDSVTLNMEKELPKESLEENTSFDLSSATDKMLLWGPIEKKLFLDWQLSNPQGKPTDYALEEKLNSVKLVGIVEPYTRAVKNKPGDYLLRLNNKTVAYLYSTKVDMQDKIGKEVAIVGSPRPNNHFAFPAYHVVTAE
ncbi:MAG: hypothetical protein ACI9S8_002194 [Chlamydiales bacterium]|jgi:hypothetical protein